MGLESVNVAIYFGTFLLSLLLCYFYLNSPSLGISDVANERSMHQGITKKSGGIWIYISSSISILIFSSITGSDFPLHWWSGLSFFFFLGLLDDLKGLSPYVRFGAEFIFLFAWVSWNPIPIVLFGLDLGNFPGGLGETLLISLYLLFFINLCNFMDGLDTYLVGSLVAIAISFSICYKAILPNYYMLLFSAVFGFLAWNLPKAKLFLGDSGSLPLGFAMGTLPFLHLQAQTKIELSSVFFLAPVFFTDGIFTILTRIFKKENIFLAHRDHLYQKFAVKTTSKGWVSFLFVLANFPSLLVWHLLPSPISFFVGVGIYSGLYFFLKYRIY
ncbi:UDP-phosphate N-acetylglucosaminyl 1-phosphate transferase [Leptospira perolatii]|uniref:UDP-phosphate N-acetylglucosaminyl 1-phosphate transferase n=1 Tax=Leptospira perolatii TaxID=2023191 RepID=A0A2M9ZJZ7_9LEPT|nr:UDP-phosphate N-acetylglucosaminyl 1-phosphate transferase [Leptospira perolatii]PJZ69222.1 UDP-phosphate N-acetylglucosaminyl 1-phosphate transferase [Leptospira perolatii]PJZ72396.1 UDP-phosphate N-acetylglucosaminyl 1-phosphate transferase [Leptospira perolatii]